MLYKCQHSENFKKRKKSDQVCNEGVIFSMQQRAIMQNHSSLLTRIKRKSEPRARGLTPLYREWGQLCSCIQGYCYCCSQILLSPVHRWWMNHLAIGQASSYCLCNKQKRLPVTNSVLQCVLHYWSMSTAAAYFQTINLLKQEIFSKCLSQLLILSHHGICLEQFRNTWVQHLLLTYSLIIQQVGCKPHATANISTWEKRSTHGFTLHFCHHSCSPFFPM